MRIIDLLTRLLGLYVCMSHLTSMSMLMNMNTIRSKLSIYGSTISTSFKLIALHSTNVKRNNNHMTDSNSNNPKSDCKVFVGNLSFSATDDDIRALVDSQLGASGSDGPRIKDLSIPRGKKSKQGMGFFFLEFHTSDDARLAVHQFNQIQFQDRIIIANLKSEDSSSSSASSVKSLKKLRIDKHCIYLANLDFSLTEQDLIQMCNDILGDGDASKNLVVSVELPISKVTNQVRGFAYIEFGDEQMVEKALIELNNVEVFGKLLFCSRKEKMKKIM
jgi:RNA recognition motif-containing protein